MWPVGATARNCHPGLPGLAFSVATSKPDAEVGVALGAPGTELEALVEPNGVAGLEVQAAKLNASATTTAPRRIKIWGRALMIARPA